MNTYNKLSIFLIIALFSSCIYARQFLIVECEAYPGYGAYVSKPLTGEKVWTRSCGEALASVPPDYYLLSSVGAGGNSGQGVKYLFGDAPITG